MSVETGQGRSVSVEVRRGGSDARALRIEQGTIGDRETLRVIYPADAIHYPSRGNGYGTDVYVRPDGTFGDGGRDRWHRSDGRVRISGRRGDFEAVGRRQRHRHHRPAVGGRAIGRRHRAGHRG
ncbi:MAG: hypothetical protein A2W29_01500 [Gemmatimonadetes bacterium RBG_16_66_8]|nr:MAG: hypothetical protein A2W29_01500 [Gemmatimonadetes bacterium RBG_16_66_8]